jgi:hypothetical protein
VEGIIAVYEEKETELLRNVYEYAHKRSGAHCRVIRDSLIKPDPGRLNYRTQIADIASSMVTSMQPPRDVLVKDRTVEIGVAPEDIQAVTKRALAQLINLNVGSARRYRVRPSEFDAWTKQFRSIDR